jgi:signal transduction histidine kinase
MRLAPFILTHLDSILRDWVDFAKGSISAGRGMTELALRDDAEDILREVAREMSTRQDAEEQQAKSQGAGSTDNAVNHEPARAHALQRARSGFEVNQMVSEFRALRATVLRLWASDAGSADARDLTDVTRFNEAIDQALAQSLKHFVSEVDRARSMFLGTLGHDLRTPLSTIGTCATILQRRRPDDTRETEMIARSTARMKELVDVVLAYTRRSLGAVLSISPKAMDIEDVVRHCVNELVIANPTHDVALETSGSTQGTWDPARLAQVTSNLLGNALKYGDPARQVLVRVDGTDPDELALQVHNFGGSIDPELLHNIFEPLVRGAAPSAAGVRAGGADMGLGLYIAREIVGAHGGSIRVTSDPEAGTLFDVRLPRAAHHEQPVVDRH